MAGVKMNNDDLSLKSLIRQGDSLIDEIILNKTIKSCYVREETGKLVALQFPDQDRPFWDSIDKFDLG